MRKRLYFTVPDRDARRNGKKRGQSLKQDEFFAANLRLLTSEVGSISAACQEIGMNRQQFNKYLAGTHRPSRANGKKIADYFGVSFLDLLETDLRLETRDTLTSALSLTRMPQWRRLEKSSRSADVEAFHGRYLGYHFSAVRPGQIISYMLLLYPWNGLTGCTILERFPSLIEPGRHREGHKCYGLASLLESKLYIFEFDERHKSELGCLIFSTPARASGEFLFGVRASVEASHLRRPFTSNTVLRRMDASTPLLSLVRQTTVLKEDARALPEDILHYLRSNPPE